MDMSKMLILFLIPSNITNNEVLFFIFLIICLFIFFWEIKNINSQKNKHELDSVQFTEIQSDTWEIANSQEPLSLIPLFCNILYNAWWAAIHGVTKGQARLSN